MKHTALSPQRKQLVSEHLHLVPQVVRSKIRRNESVYGLGNEELLQEGYLLLCKAAISFNPQSGEFEPYARKVIYNGLVSHCRKVYQHERRFSSLDTDDQGCPLPSPEYSFTADTFAHRVEMIEVLDLLSFYAQQHRGTTKRGIEALSQKIQGASVSDIANAWGIPPSHVGAWISKAKTALCRDPKFIQAIL